MHGHIYFEIQAEDIPRSIGFYSKLFGREFTKVPYAPLAYWHIETGRSVRGTAQVRGTNTCWSGCFLDTEGKTLGLLNRMKMLTNKTH